MPDPPSPTAQHLPELAAQVPAPSPAPRRHRMRDLGTGPVPDGPPAGEAGPPAVVAGGPAPDEQTFLASLGNVLAGIGGGDERVLAFRARGRPVALQRWTESRRPTQDEIQAAVEERLLDVDPTIVTLRLAGEVIGFASGPRTPAEAQRLGGALAARLGHVLGWPDAPVAISPRLGVAIVEGPGTGVGRLAAAVAEAVDAVDRTLSQTTNETPYLVHNDYIRSRARRQRRIGRALGQALAERQVTLEFQPRVRLADECHVGLEVLPCWTHPQLGAVPAGDLLLAAEREGLSLRLARRIRADALGLARQWAVEGTLGGRRLWFDLSPAELLDDAFIDEVARITEALTEVSVGFELADGSLLDDVVLGPAIEALEELGVALAIDDLRPSVPALARLQKLPVSQVNLDGSLLRPGGGEAGAGDLVRAVCARAAERSVDVAMYGIADEDELALARELGVDVVQGPAVSDPVAESDLWPLLDRPGG